jgi:hypothetical protein
VSLFSGPALSQLDQLALTLELSTLGCSSTHNTLQVLQRTSLGPEPPKAGLGYCIPQPLDRQILGLFIEDSPTTSDYPFGILD